MPSDDRPLCPIHERSGVETCCVNGESPAARHTPPARISLIGEVPQRLTRETVGYFRPLIVSGTRSTVGVPGSA